MLTAFPNDRRLFLDTLRIGVLLQNKRMELHLYPALVAIPLYRLKTISDEN